MREKSRINLTNEQNSSIKVILWLTWPLFLEHILTTLVSYADTAMVGALGINATASVSISNSFVFLINGVIMALGVGITTYMAQSIGARDIEGAKAYIRHALLILIYVGVPLSGLVVLLNRQIPQWMGAKPEILDTAATYLLITSLFRIFGLASMILGGVFRGCGDTKTPLRINIAVNLINVAGNYLLINPSHEILVGTLSIPMWGANLGVAGAAWSTGISWLIGGIVMIIMLYTKDSPTRISIHDSMRMDKVLMKRIVSISIPAMLERFCMSTAGIVFTKAVASLGTVVVAANSVYVTAESISFMPGFAFASAVTVLVGQALGAKKVPLAKRFTYATMALSASVLAIAGFALYLFARPLVSLFTPDEEAIRLAVRCLRIVAFIQPIQVAAWVLAGALRGAGDTKGPFYITAICNWGIRSLGAWLCIRVFGLGLPEAVLCACADCCLRMVLSWLRFRKCKWVNTVSDTGSYHDSDRLRHSVAEEAEEITAV
jgi:putative MATE family efflux protein